MPYEIREALKPFDKQRIEVRGTLDGFEYWKHNSRDSLRACIVDPEVLGKVISHHVWVMNCPTWKEYKDRLGQTVVFKARVASYVDQKRLPKQTNYCLFDPDDPVFPFLPSALKVPDKVEKRGGLNGDKSRQVLNEIMVVEEYGEPDQPLAAVSIVRKPTKSVSTEPLLTPPKIVVPPPPVVAAVTAPVPSPADALVMLKQARRFVKACGRVDRAKEILTFLKENPGLDPQALELWVTALQEE
jgi:hypothetical protein